MKKIITYISFFAALVFAASCINERVSRDNEEGDGTVTLCLQTSALETRAGDSETDIEFAVTHADFFFFSDAEGTDLLYHTRLFVEDGGLTPAGTNRYKYTFDVSSDGNPLKKTSYLYVIANYPEEISATTLENILALDIKTDLSGEFSSFVMDSYQRETNKYVYQLKAPQDGIGEFVIGLTRAAAKLVLTVNVADSYTDDLGNVWEPVFDGMWVNFVNARKKALVKAEPVPFDNKENYFNTEQETPMSVTPAPTDFTSWKVSPVYTYPQSYETSDVTAPYFKIFCRWSCEKYNMSNFYYKVILPDLGSFQRNKVYNLTVNLSTIGGDQDDWALFSDYIYVADWFDPNKIPTAVESARYLDVPVKYYEIYGINDIRVPVVSSNDIQIVSCTGIQQRVQETLSSIDDVHGKTVRAVSLIPTATTGNRCVPDGSESFYLYYGLDPVITTSSNSTFDCTPIKWTIKIKHKVTSDEPYLRKEVTVVIMQYPSIYGRLVMGLNSFVNGYYTVQEASVTPHPNTEARVNGYYRYMTSNGTIWSGSSNTANYGGLNTDGLSTRTKTMTLITVSAFAANSNSYTVVSNGDNQPTKEYIIGDPRVDAGYKGTDLYNYLWGTQTRAWTDAAASTIKKGSDVQKNLIAPAFMFNSEVAGRPGTSGNLNWERAQKRCATYQEAGYPAGRWRLPTEAEIFFAYSLQRMGVIDNLFNGGDGYYASSGNVFGWNQGQTWTFQARGTANHSVRCVYDVWYWGEDVPERVTNVNTYYPGTLN